MTARTEIDMGATLRRTSLRAVLVVLMMCAFGAIVGVANGTAVALPAAGSATPGVPTSTIQSVNGDTVTYCVSNYAPNSNVTVVNELTGDTRTIHTDANGSGCTTIPVRQACDTSTTQNIVASGTGADGHPATSQVTYNAPPNSALCVTPSPTPTPTSTCKPSQAQLSVTVVAGGAIIRGVACGFLSGETVFVYLHSAPIFVGSTVANDDGTAADRVKIPRCIEPGVHTFMMVGQTSGNVATADFRVPNLGSGCAGHTGAGGGSSGGGVVLPVGANSGGGTGGGGSLAFTGADIAAMILAALVLIAIGTLAVVTVRRRRAAPTAPAA